MESKGRNIKFLYRVAAMFAVALILCTAGKLQAQNRDSLKTALQAADSVLLHNADTLSAMDSLAKGDSLHIVIPSKKELRKMHRDSVRAYRDSVIRNTPRILNTYLFADTTKNKRMFLWTADTYFNKPVNINPDTTYNDWYSEQPYERYDAGATSLGVSGSAMMYHNYFKRKELKVFPFFEYYLPYSYLPETLPFYNTKTPYTELAYWGTLFANKKMEESNIRVLHTQNFTPALNFNFLYERFGGEGMLQYEKTDNRTLAFTGNYLGKRYMAQGGYIFNRIKRDENGGVTDPSMVLDTLLEAKVIPVALNNANNTLKRNTVFITHSYGIPFKFLYRGDKDSVGLGEGTMAYIGHSADASVYSKKYTDNISLSDLTGRELYHNKFYINPTVSADSMRVFKLENRVFLNIQPWAKDAIVSNLSGGIGHQFLSLYGFDPKYFIQGNSSAHQNNMYMYFGAGGNLKKYFRWEGFGTYNFAGYYQNDFAINGKVTFSSYPKKMKQGIHLHGNLHIGMDRPNYFYNNAYTNHYVWSNNFEKTAQTKIEARLDIPDWGMEAFAGYSLLKNNTYFDSTSVIRQNTEAMSVFTAYLSKNIKIWKLHLDNKILFQTSSNEKVVPLPKLSLNLRYYLQLDVVKNVLTAQLGANASFMTKYYAPGYSPALGVFYNQRTEKIGNTPYIDLFANLQWKRASIFVKYINMAQGWPDGDYFSAFRYIRSQKAFKLGIHWPFYTK